MSQVDLDIWECETCTFPLGIHRIGINMGDYWHYKYFDADHNLIGEAEERGYSWVRLWGRAEGHTDWDKTR